MDGWVGLSSPAVVVAAAMMLARLLRRSSNAMLCAERVRLGMHSRLPALVAAPLGRLHLLCCTADTQQSHMLLAGLQFTCLLFRSPACLAFALYFSLACALPSPFPSPLPPR